MSKGTVVTFYSYKGGVGRTFALANIGALLCRWGFRVLCIDWDLEAPGLHVFFQKWSDSPDRSGLVELVQSFADGKEPKWEDHVTSVRLPNTSQPLYLMTAGSQDESYARRMQQIDWTKLYETQKLGFFLEKLRDQWKDEFDFVLIDSRTGVTDIGGICTVQLPDLLVLLVGTNEQNLRGSLDVIGRAKRARNDLPVDRANLLVLPVIARFELRAEYERSESYVEEFTRVFSPFYSEWLHKRVQISQMLSFARIPYVPYWSLGERLPVVEKGTEDSEDIGYPLETLAALIAQQFAHSDVLAQSRDRFVAAARVGPVKSNGAKQRGVEVFYSYSHRDEGLRDQLAKHLVILKRTGLISEPYVRCIDMGENWEGIIDAHLESAGIILLLVSPDFLASGYCWDVELKRAMQRHEEGTARVIPVILRPCDWKMAPFGRLQALPSDGKAITVCPDRDEGFLEISKGIRREVEFYLSGVWTSTRRGEALRQAGRYSEALTELESVIKRDPNYAAALASRGATRWLMGHQTEGLADLNRAIELAPDDWFSYQRAILFMASGDAKRAYNDLQSAIAAVTRRQEQNPDECTNRFNLALYHLAAGHEAEAKECYRQTLDRRPPDHALRAALGDLDEFLSLFPTHAQAQAMKERVQAALRAAEAP